MLGFGDELTIEGYNNIPWLIWIQTLVLLLLIFLLYYSSFSTSDLSDHDLSSASTSYSLPSLKRPDTAAILIQPSLTVFNKPRIFNSKIMMSDDDDNPWLETSVSLTRLKLYNNTIGKLLGQNESVKGKLATSTGRRIVSEDNPEGNYSTTLIGIDYEYHPCNYFRLAKLAFLKCFGWDYSSENSSRSERKKER